MRSFSQLSDIGLKQYLDGTEAHGRGCPKGGPPVIGQQHGRSFAATKSGVPQQAYNYVGLHDKRKLYQSAYERVWLKEQRQQKSATELLVLGSATSAIHISREKSKLALQKGATVGNQAGQRILNGSEQRNIINKSQPSKSGGPVQKTGQRGESTQCASGTVPPNAPLNRVLRQQHSLGYPQGVPQVHQYDGRWLAGKDSYDDRSSLERAEHQGSISLEANSNPRISLVQH